jgi:hypothetical protein
MESIIRGYSSRANLKNLNSLLFIFIVEIFEILVARCLAASASSSQASRTGFKAIMLLWDRVRDSNLEIELRMY